MCRGSCDTDCLIVEVLDASWSDCSRLTRGDYETQRCLFCVEEDRQSNDMGRQWQKGKLGFHDYSKRTFAADEPVDGIVGEGVANRVLLEIGSAELYRFTVCHHHFQRPHVVPRCAVFERASAGRVTGNRSANRGFFLAGRIRREQETSSS